MVKRVNLIQGGRFWKVSSHCFLHFAPGCDIITALFNYSSSLSAPPKNESNNGAGAQLVRFLFGPSITSSQWNCFLPFLICLSDQILIIFRSSFAASVQIQSTGGCFLSLSILSLFPPHLPSRLPGVAQIAKIKLLISCSAAVATSTL